MMLEEVCSALSSRTRIEILKILARGPKSLKEILNELNERSFKIKYRASVFRALEKLTSAGLVEKYYDREREGINYRLLKTGLNINLVRGTVS